MLVFEVEVGWFGKLKPIFAQSSRLLSRESDEISHLSLLPLLTPFLVSILAEQ